MVIHSLRGGGSERVLLNLLKGLDRKEFSVTLVLYEKEFDYPLPEDVDVQILDIRVGRNIFTLATGFLSKIKALVRVIKRDSPDVIFSLLSSTNAAVILANMLSGKRCKTVVSEHTHPSVNLRNERYGWGTKWFMKWLYPKADRIIAVSGGIKEDLVRHFGIRQDVISIIHNPIDIREIQRLSIEDVDHSWFLAPVPIILAVGRLTKQKGYPYLLRAFSEVRKSLDCRLLIIGEGEDREMLVRMVNEMGLNNEVELLGFQPNPFKYMARSSLLVLSSLYEGFGNVIVEAMALGLPVISTDCPSGPSEIIDGGKNGLLVPLEDAVAMAQAMVNVLTDDALRETLSKGGKARACAFAIARIIESYRSVFLEDPSSSL